MQQRRCGLHLLTKEPQSEGSTKRNIVIAFVLLFFTLSWWPLTLSYLKSPQPGGASYSMETIVTRTTYYLSVVISSIIGSVIARKVKALRFLYYWMATGVVLSLVPMFFSSASGWQLLTAAVLLGSAFGIGMPSCLALFAELVRLEIRGTISGAVFLASNLAIAALALALGNIESTLIALVAGIWRLTGLVLFILFRPRSEVGIEQKGHASFAEVLRNRQFLYYFVPWLAFCLIDFFENPIRRELFGGFAESALIIGPIIGSLSAIIGGVFSDKIGRKIMVLYSFVSIGLAYAVLSLVPNDPLVWYFYTIINGVAWGILTSIFILTLWGDLSQTNEREKYYAIGNAPFFIAGIIGLVVEPYVSLIRPDHTFSLAAFFLFLAVLPLLYAPETLPEKRIKERELKGYLEKAKKLKEKHV